MEKSIENMLMTCVRYAANVLNIKYLHKDTISELIDHFKYYFAVEYLKRNDWSKRISITELTLALFDNGKYYNQYHDMEMSRDNKLGIYKDMTQYRKYTFYHVRDHIEQQNTKKSERIRFESIYKLLLKCNRKINFDKKKKAVIYKIREKRVISKSKLIKERKTRETLRQFEVIDLIAIYSLYKDKIEHKLDNIDDIYRRLSKNQLHLIKYNELELLVNYFKAIYKLGSLINPLAENNIVQKITATIYRLIGAGVIDSEMINSPIFQYHSYYTLEQKYSMETIKTFAAQLKLFNQKTERDKKEIRDEKRTMFKQDIMTVFNFPIIKERCDYINSYIDYYKSNDLDSWRYEVKAISNLFTITYNLIKRWIGDKSTDEQHHLYRELVGGLNDNDFIISHDSFDTNLEYDTHFNSIHFRAICEIMAEKSESMKVKINETLDKAMLTENFCNEFARIYSNSADELPESPTEDILMHRYEEIFDILYEKITEIISVDELMD